ncbi:MAG: Beta-lactamase, partial [Actinomycetota bacterium]
MTPDQPSPSRWLVRGVVLILLGSLSVVPAHDGKAAAPRLFAANLFVEIIASQVLEKDGDAISVGVVDVGGIPFGAVRQRGAAEPPLTIDTPFRLASVSKTVTATVVLGLVDDASLSLDDRPLVALLDSRGLPCGIEGLSDIRVRDLL